MLGEVIVEGIANLVGQCLGEAVVDGSTSSRVPLALRLICSAILLAGVGLLVWVVTSNGSAG